MQLHVHVHLHVYGGGDERRSVHVWRACACAWPASTSSWPVKPNLVFMALMNCMSSICIAVLLSAVVSKSCVACTWREALLPSVRKTAPVPRGVWPMAQHGCQLPCAKWAAGASNGKQGIIITYLMPQRASRGSSSAVR